MQQTKVIYANYSSATDSLIIANEEILQIRCMKTERRNEKQNPLELKAVRSVLALRGLCDDTYIKHHSCTVEKL